MRRPDRSHRARAGLVLVAALAGCGGDEAAAPVSPPSTTAQPAPAPEPPVRDMKPAETKPEPKAVDAKAVDELPPLEAPAGAKDDRPDAAKPKS